MKRLALIALAAALFGCNPMWKATGAVVQAPAQDAPSGTVTADDQPIAGAIVDVRCPSGYMRRTTTDEEGRFKLVQNGSLPKVCTVDVAAPGFAPRRFMVAELCVFEWDERACSIVGVRAELSPTSQPPPAPAPRVAAAAP